MTDLIHRNSSGVFVIAATPFTEDGALDLASTDRMVDFYLETGVTGMTILGIMGEAPKLSGEESRSFVKRVLARIDGRVPVIVGVSGAGIDPMRALTAEVMAAGAAGVMLAPMQGMGPEDRIEGYFGQVCKALGPDVPVCLQDYPQTTGVRMSVESILKIARDNPQVVMLKHEDWPGLTKLSRVRAETGTGEQPRLSILTGNSALFLPQEMQRGADGAMTGFAYPEMMVQVVDLSLKGDHDRAEDIFDAYLPLVRYEQQLGLGLAIRKETLRRRGVIATAKVRAPGPVMTKADHDELSRLVARLEKRLGELG
ncbi:4-hydroxy-tetrahydrodipicolinate synthase [Defluviimonas denitrificans]|jgi:4-hydroxy-tetrahydrodipicolinate synthase|uniref:4-hydroxy-tetrahydrodipicolinate synthase n=1 Tax=Albidovulum denitrificans TaxID=404881 RepID=A0A2S8S5C7_9RHOB|nr:dihydrodipicolinate synthase family protein [Defluviimonas denitrificans]PQV55974.1 4-hydroxy-tetrahydrodipicolinate synthase [Defluviimonas denitrificans]